MSKEILEVNDSTFFKKSKMRRYWTLPELKKFEDATYHLLSQPCKLLQSLNTKQSGRDIRRNVFDLYFRNKLVTNTDFEDRHEAPEIIVVQKFFDTLVDELQLHPILSLFVAYIMMSQAMGLGLAKSQLVFEWHNKFTLINVRRENFHRKIINKSEDGGVVLFQEKFLPHTLILFENPDERIDSENKLFDSLSETKLILDQTSNFIKLQVRFSTKLTEEGMYEYIEKLGEDLLSSFKEVFSIPKNNHKQWLDLVEIPLDDFLQSVFNTIKGDLERELEVDYAKIDKISFFSRKLLVLKALIKLMRKLISNSELMKTEKLSEWEGLKERIEQFLNDFALNILTDDHLNQRNDKLDNLYQELKEKDWGSSYGSRGLEKAIQKNVFYLKSLEILNEFSPSDVFKGKIEELLERFIEEYLFVSGFLDEIKDKFKTLEFPDWMKVLFGEDHFFPCSKVQMANFNYQLLRQGNFLHAYNVKYFHCQVAPLEDILISYKSYYDAQVLTGKNQIYEKIELSIFPALADALSAVDQMNGLSLEEAYTLKLIFCRIAGRQILDENAQNRPHMPEKSYFMASKAWQRLVYQTFVFIRYYMHVLKLQLADEENPQENFNLALKQ